MKDTKKASNKLPVPGKVRKAFVSTAPLCCQSLLCSAAPSQPLPPMTRSPS